MVGLSGCDSSEISSVPVGVPQRGHVLLPDVNWKPHLPQKTIRAPFKQQISNNRVMPCILYIAYDDNTILPIG